MPGFGGLRCYEEGLGFMALSVNLNSAASGLLRGVLGTWQGTGLRDLGRFGVQGYKLEKKAIAK